MRRDVLISIIGLPDLHEEPVMLTTPGRLYRKDGVYSITFRGTELCGAAGVTTTMKMEPDRVTIMRRGGDNACMVFRQGERHYNLLTDDSGKPVTVSIAANNVRQKFTDSGGVLDIDYSVLVDNAHARRSCLHVDVRSFANQTQTT